MSSFIIGDESWIQSIVKCFDGHVDIFLLDCEQKNSISCLAEKATMLITQSNVMHFRANAMTVNALEAFIATHIKSLYGKVAAIFGPGNIGCKAALMLAERGADVRLKGRDSERVQRIATTLNEICRGNGRITVAKSSYEAAGGAHVVLGCTPGVPVVDSEAIAGVATNALLMDAGNGTFFPDAVTTAASKGIPVLCLTPDAGFAALMAALEAARRQADAMGTRDLPCGLRAITPGILGRRGDILVTDLSEPLSIVGVCDGLGDTLPPDLANQYITMALEHDTK
ncbi:hypothetical protein [Nitratidesulfovibrio liaohensis]|uniref:Pyrroline-5-carboxylate reductase catalytic N-terminal domain-containing protein n=1 Tax=Nitratidesulfovibrio liaohensis TaxID=2604158 RepID=A0ABY9R4Y2_9BACT|nr:hypothetical protein [Nitratidesulfovibrio liaohensis]WMW66277.1 hypothetical protein KPS_000840 [Nitratidesulfovibrio liaohensis]